MFFTLTYVQVVCLNFVACFFIAFVAVLFGGAAAFAAFGGAAAFADFFAFGGAAAFSAFRAAAFA